MPKTEFVIELPKRIIKSNQPTNRISTYVRIYFSPTKTVCHNQIFLQQYTENALIK